MLFSEPKIPQREVDTFLVDTYIRFSALQRAENSSNGAADAGAGAADAFQCSSASRKFLKRSRRDGGRYTFRRFQCSSASRKFLKPNQSTIQRSAGMEFQCSSASRKFLKSGDDLSWEGSLVGVSVLFSEPKIPQKRRRPRYSFPSSPFQCSSASRKFLKAVRIVAHTGTLTFQCSSASRKFLKARPSGRRRAIPPVSVLFSEPKIPQNVAVGARVGVGVRFSALQRAENSSNGRQRAPTPDV